MAQLILLLFVFSSFCCLQVSGKNSFVIDYKNDQFLKDGKPFRYISGSLHYFRVPRIYWQDRFERMLAAGLSAVETYIEWSLHEPYPGVHDFKDNLDLVSFIQLAQKMGLLVILRPGPYIDAERDFGGFPFWLMQVNPNIKLRSNDQTYIKYLDRWFGTLLPMMKPLLYSNGGPIISVQVENEYGSYYTCDFDYLVHMRDLIRTHLGKKVILFTTDGSADSLLKCGKLPEVYATVDFGPGTNVTDAFRVQRNHQPHGPHVNSEYYPGWLDHWGYPHANPDINVITKTLDEILSFNASVSMYMFHGGTNFGFTNGANWDGTFQACPTSYDYNAPISEAGDTTEKYFAIRKVISKYSKVAPGPIPKPIPKYAYGKVDMTPIAALFELLPFLNSNSRQIFSEYPLTFESLGQAYGFVLYETLVTGLFMDPVALQVPGVQDRALVFVDEIPVGILSRQDNIVTMPVTILKGQKLSLLVENQGRICFGPKLLDFKGLTSNVTLGSKILTNWMMTPIPLNNTKEINSLVYEILHSDTDFKHKARLSGDGRYYTPGVFAGTFNLPNNKTFPLDTYLDVTGWHKGVAFINGFNLGRYWPIVGPQITLYVPKSVLKPYPSKNILILFELEHAPCYSDNSFFSGPHKCAVQFLDTPTINSTTPNSGQQMGAGNFYANDWQMKRRIKLDL